MSAGHDDQSYLSAPSPNPSHNGSNEPFINPSPIAPSSNGTEFTDLDEAVEHQNSTTSIGGRNAVQRQCHNVQQPELKVREVNDADGTSTG
jgi:hypothetical protein